MIPEAKAKLEFEDVEQLYDDGCFTLAGVYMYCETDLDMYNFLANHCGFGDEMVKEKMRNVSGSDDAYYNALKLAE